MTHWDPYTPWERLPKWARALLLAVIVSVLLWLIFALAGYIAGAGVRASTNAGLPTAEQQGESSQKCTQPEQLEGGVDRMVGNDGGLRGNIAEPHKGQFGVPARPGDGQTKTSGLSVHLEKRRRGLRLDPRGAARSYSGKGCAAPAGSGT